MFIILTKILYIALRFVKARLPCLLFVGVRGGAYGNDRGIERGDDDDEGEVEVLRGDDEGGSGDSGNGGGNDGGSGGGGDGRRTLNRNQFAARVSLRVSSHQVPDCTDSWANILKKGIEKQ